MEDQNKYIENLLERFFDGDTSNAEEQELYQFFGGNNIPQHLEKYKPMFEYFENGMVEELTQPDIQTHEPTAKKKTLPKHIWLAVGAIAASVLVLIGLNIYHSKTSFNPYEGSYIVENGVKIYEMDKIVEQQKLIEQQIEKQEKEFQNILHSYDDSDINEMRIN